MDSTELPPTATLVYSIAGGTEHSNRYGPENILLDRPEDTSSRWSTAYPTPKVKQFILLKLEYLSVVKTITFGKYHKQHPCNMKEFKVYVGMTEDRMIEALSSGLKNDSFPETFPLKHTNPAGLCFPIRFVKIVPLSAHGQSFHTSIWYVSLAGIADQGYVKTVRTRYEEYLESATLRRVLKHLRQRRLLTPYHSLLSRTNVYFEHPLISSLYDALVIRGAFMSLPPLLTSISNAGLLDAYTRLSQPRAAWTRLTGSDPDGDRPSRRSAHAMCMDGDAGVAYLLGGWDGQENLDDFWAYDVNEDQWKVLSLSTEKEKNGPGRRSCHKMVFDKRTGCIYVLGRMGDEEMNSTPETAPVQGSSDAGGSAPFSEFYRYHTRGLDIGKWDLLTFDTASGGGPPLIFDHQMAIDSEAQMIYVFGGRVVDKRSIKYSGLYSYNIRTNKWKMLQSVEGARSSGEVGIPPRSGHSMVLEPNSKTLVIFAGQREEKYLSDMFTYQIETGTVTEVFSDYTMDGGPKPCFTQRAVLDPELKEIYVFCGLSRQQPSNQIILQSQAPYWVYRYPPMCSEKGKWTKLVPADLNPSLLPLSPSAPSTDPEELEPKPRYAHQLVYDGNTKTLFMHGGNAGIRDGDGLEGAVGEEREIRLDDFWKMTLRRMPREEVARKVLFEVRKQQFREMCEDEPTVEALDFLRDEVSSVVNHNDAEEEDVFRSLMSHLVAQSPRVESVRDSRARALSMSEELPSVSLSLNDVDTDMATSPPLASPTDKTSAISSSRPPLSWDQDPEEKRGKGDVPELSAERFKQRTEVFQRILTFVDEEAKEPDNDLIHMIDGW